MLFKNLNFYFTSLLFLTLLSTCQSDKPSGQSASEVPNMAVPDKLYAHYYVRYLADEKKLTAEATFLTGAPKKKRTTKQFNNVTLGDREMRLDKTSKGNPYYKLEQNDMNQKKIRFQYISDNGHKESDVMEILGMNSFSFSGNFSVAKGGALSWEGVPLGEEESLVLLFTNAEERTTSTIINGPSKTAKVPIPLEKTKNISPGKNRVYIVRKNRFIENKTGADGTPREIRALTEFYSVTEEVTINR